MIKPAIVSTDTDDVALDPFAPENLRIRDSFAEDGIKKLLNTVPVGKPSAQTWFRVHPDRAYQLRDVGLISLKDDNEYYLISPQLAAELEGEFEKWTVFTAISRQGVIRLWPIRQIGSDGKSNPWWDSAREAADQATTAWTRLSGNRHLGAYDIRTAAQSIEPSWPELAMADLLRIAFKNGHLIDSVEHPVVRQLRGIE